jgi:integral membrane protein
VQIVGWAHGILFVIFCAALLRVMLVARWPVRRCALVFVAGLVPFGPFLLDRRMAEWGNDER